LADDVGERVGRHRRVRGSVLLRYESVLLVIDSLDAGLATEGHCASRQKATRHKTGSPEAEQVSAACSRVARGGSEYGAHNPRKPPQHAPTAARTSHKPPANGQKQRSCRFGAYRMESPARRPPVDHPDRRAPMAPRPSPVGASPGSELGFASVFHTTRAARHERGAPRDAPCLPRLIPVCRNHGLQRDTVSTWRASQARTHERYSSSVALAKLNGLSPQF